MSCSRPKSAYRSHEDLIAVGAYKPGADRQVDAAVALRQEMHRRSCASAPTEASSFDAARAQLLELAARLQTHQNGRSA